MPTFVGTMEQFPQVIGLDPYTSANLFTTRDYYTGDVLPAVLTPESGLTLSRVVGAPSPSVSVFPGSKSNDFFSDWYDRIHIVPSAIDIGNLVSTQTQSISLWNAYQTSKPFGSFNLAGGDGITVTPPPGLVPPTTLQAFQFVTYTITIGIAGPSVIDAQITYTIDGVAHQVTIVGRRVVLMPFPPNWAGGVEEVLQYKSSVSRSFDGTEQTMSYRVAPRRRVSYTALLKNRDAQLLDNLMYGWQSRLYGVPLWFDKSALSAEALAGAFDITLTASNIALVAGSLLAVYADARTHDVREIESVVGTTITLKAPLSRTWAAGSRVYPVMIGAIDSSLSGRRLTDSIVEMPLSFEGEPSSNKYPYGEGAFPVSYRGVELFEGRPNWGGGLSFEWASDAGRFDPQSGQYRMIPYSVYSDVTRSVNWTLKGHDEMTSFRQWSQRRLGMARPVWAPSGVTDFTLLAQVLLGDGRLDVSPNDYDLFGFNTDRRKDIYIRLRSGTSFARRITAATKESGGFIALQLDSGVPEAFTPEDVVKMNLLHFSRLSSDDISIRWLNDELATVDASFVTKKGGI